MDDVRTVEILEDFLEQLHVQLPDDRDQAEVEAAVKCLSLGWPELWDLLQFEEGNLWHLDLLDCLSSPHRIVVGRGRKDGASERAAMREYLVLIALLPLDTPPVGRVSPPDTPGEVRRRAQRMWDSWQPCQI